MTNDVSHVRRELLTYLASVPKTLRDKGPDSAAEVAIALGNAFLWLRGTLEPHEPPIEVSLDETPQSIYALGKQLRAVGLLMWDKKLPVQNLDRLSAMERDIDRLRMCVSRMGGDK
jgi:hypothetical protein